MTSHKNEIIVKIKPSPLKITEDEPFKNDTISQEKYVIIFKKLIQSYNDNLVFLLTGRWGAGKTTFLKMLQAQLKNEECNVIYINAWESDYYNEPLPVLIEAFSDQLKFNDKLKSGLKKAGGSLLKSTISSSVKLATANLVDLTKPIDDLLSSICKKYGEAIVNQYIASKKHIQIIRDNINKIIEDLNEKKDLNEEDGNLYIFIDELDRCKPTYSIKFLELLKHVFNINNVKFVLAIDDSGIFESIKKVYGNEFDSEGYLRRFFDIKYSLPSPDVNSFSKALLNRMGYDKIFSSIKHEEDETGVIDTLTFLAPLFNLTLRDIEQIIDRFGIILSLSQNKKLLYFTEFLIFLIILREHNSEKYEEISNHKTNLNDLLQYFDKKIKTNNFFDDFITSLFLNNILYFIDPKYQGIDSLIEKETQLDRKNKLKDLKKYSEYRWGVKYGSKLYSNYKDTISEIIECIELTNRIETK